MSSVNISIHSLRMEGDVFLLRQFHRCIGFQSTPSAWRETVGHCSSSPVTEDFNPLPPHGGRRACTCIEFAGVAFQSTPSAWRETTFVGFCKTSLKRFQSTPSAWRETDMQWYLVRIHRHFNPLPPHGGRPGVLWLVLTPLGISIHSLRMEGDVSQFCTESVVFVISIHSLRMEGDTDAADAARCNRHFNPLPPHGGRQEV